MESSRGQGTSLISLAEAVQRYRQEDGAPSNAYDWYRKHAHTYGTAYIGQADVPVRKVGSRWMVEESDLAAALADHRERRRLVRQATDDYRARRLNGGDGDRVETLWGSYTIRGDFHVAHHSGVPMGHDSDYWWCNTCWRPTGTEHGREECHRCSDWSSCGNDCTLSRVYCDPCGTSRAV